MARIRYTPRIKKIFLKRNHFSSSSRTGIQRRENLQIKINLFLLGLTIISTIVSAMSVYFAFQANRKSDEANRIAQEANSINLSGMKAEISLFERYGFHFIFVSGCWNDASKKSYSLGGYTNLPVLVTNTTGKPTKIYNVKLTGPKHHPMNWFVKLYGNGKELEYPITIPGNSSQRWLFTAETSLTPDNGEDETKFYQELLTDRPKTNDQASVQWTVILDNGETANLTKVTAIDGDPGKPFIGEVCNPKDDGLADYFKKSSLNILNGPW